MFARVLKHEFAAWLRSYSRILVIIGSVYAAGILFTFLRIPFFAAISGIFAVLALIAIPISLAINIIVQYYRSLYGPRGYLTHTLPVTAGTIYGAKLLAASIQLTLSFVLMAAGFWLLAGVSDLASGFRFGFRFARVFDALFAIPNFGRMTAILIVFLLTSLIAGTMSIFYAITKGSESRWQSLGIGGPILVYIIIYAIQQLAGIVATFLVPIGLRIDMRPIIPPNGIAEPQLPRISIVTGNMFESFRASLTNPNPEVPIVGIGAFILIYVFAALLAVLTIHSLRHRTSLR